MSWQKYSLTFRLLSPLHIGWRKLSNLMQTRPYVTGKVMWGALTARLVRDHNAGATGTDYERIGLQVNEMFGFGYLYPALPTVADQPVQCANALTLHYPWSDPHFDYRFLDSQASTALNYDQQAAESGLLHETEFIRPYARPLSDETSAPQVYLVGDLYVRTELPAELQGWQDALTQLQVGGERGYGWGRIELIGCDKTEVIHSDSIQLLLKKSDSLLAHLATKSHHQAGVTGPIEPLIGWERDNKNGAAWKLSDKAVICYAPGSKVTTDSTFQIGPYGIWEAA